MCQGKLSVIVSAKFHQDVSVQVGRVRSPVPQPRGEHRQVALETLGRFLGLRLEVHDFRLLVFFFYLFLSFKGLAWEMERGLSSEEPLPLFQITCLALSVHVRWLGTACNPSSKRSDFLLWPP